MRMPGGFEPDQVGWFGCVPVLVDSRTMTVVGRFWLADILIPLMGWFQGTVITVMTLIDPLYEPAFWFSLRPIAKDDAPDESVPPAR